jgi:hypothetical protein
MSAAESLTLEELDAMSHATGWNEGKNRLYRNHYVCGDDSDTWPVLQALCDRGLMRVRRHSDDDQLFGGMTTFSVTDAGIEALKRWRP